MKVGAVAVCDEAPEVELSVLPDEDPELDVPVELVEEVDELELDPLDPLDPVSVDELALELAVEEVEELPEVDVLDPEELDPSDAVEVLEFEEPLADCDDPELDAPVVL